MEITKQRLLDIIKEEIMEQDDQGLAPVPLHKDAGKPATPSPVPRTKYAADPTVQDLMFKIEKLMSRVEKLEKMLQTKPSPSQEDSYGDTEEMPLP